MKKWISGIIFCFFVSSFLFCQVVFAQCTSEQSQSHWITCTDFDGTNPPPNWPTCGGVSWQGWQVMNWACTDPLYNPLSSLATTVKYSGTRSLKHKKAAGGHAATNIYYDFADQTKIHVRMYVRFDSSWSNVNVHDPDNYWHFIFFNTAVSGTNFGVDIYDCTDFKPWNIICCKPHPGGMYLGFHSYSAGSSGGEEWQIGPSNVANCWDLKQHLDEWHCHEFMWDLANGKARHWIDGVLITDRSIRAASHSSIRRVMIDQWISNGDGVDYEVSTYIDNIVIATDYIGPMGAGSPNPPQNLRIVPSN